MLGRVVQVVILFTTLVIGIEQIGINVGFLTNVLLVIIGVLLAGGALAFGLGAKTLIANIIGAQYLRKHCRIGEWMRLGDVEGIIVEVTQTSIVLDTELGRTVIPAQHFQEQISSFRSEIVGAPPLDDEFSAPGEQS
jgi:small-conductance mechanosensitive channel